MPYTGSFHVYAKNLLNPATGFTVAILYWLTWTIALGSEFTAAGIIMRHWFPSVPVWIWSLVFMILIFLSISSRSRFSRKASFGSRPSR